MKCTRCHEHPATSVATGLCSACLYAEVMGAEAAARQLELARAEQERELQERRVPKAKRS